MKRLIFLCLALAPVSACTAASTAGAVLQAATSPTPLGDAYTFDERGDAGLAQAYVLVAQLYQSARQSGLCNSACRDTWRPLVQQARRYQLDAHTAYLLGQATTWSDRVARFRELSARITAQFAPH